MTWTWSPEAIWAKRRARWDECCSALRGIRDAKRAWEALSTAGLLPTDWRASGYRRFAAVVTCPGCEGSGSVVLEAKHTGPGDYDEIRGACGGCGGTGVFCRPKPEPTTVWVCAALAADPTAAATAERCAREFAGRYVKWQSSIGQRSAFPGNDGLASLCWTDAWVFSNANGIRYLGASEQAALSGAQTRACARLGERPPGPPDGHHGARKLMVLASKHEVLQGRSPELYGPGELSPGNPYQPLGAMLELGFGFTGTDWGSGLLVPCVPDAWRAAAGAG